MIKCEICNIELGSSNDLNIHKQTQFHHHNRIMKRNDKQPLTMQQYLLFIQQKVPDLFKEEEKEQIMKFDKQLEINYGNTCIFCSEVLDSNDNLIQHMKNHGFFIPYSEYLKKLDNYIEFIQFRALSLKQCLSCDQYFDSVKQLQKHFFTKNHMHFPYSMEFKPYYDFSKMYPEECREEEYAHCVPFVLYTKEYVDELFQKGVLVKKVNWYVPKFLEQELLNSQQRYKTLTEQRIESLRCKKIIKQIEPLSHIESRQIENQQIFVVKSDHERSWTKVKIVVACCSFIFVIYIILKQSWRDVV